LFCDWWFSWFDTFHFIVFCRWHNLFLLIKFIHWLHDIRLWFCWFLFCWFSTKSV
jgi:hypothetical protein